jgi:hypothetical protein
MENAASKHTAIPSFTNLFRNAENSESSPRRRTKNKKAAPNSVGQLRECALEPRVAAIKKEIDKTRTKGKSTLMPRPNCQPSQRASQKRQYQQDATCNLDADNLPQPERQVQASYFPANREVFSGRSVLGIRRRQALASSNFLMRCGNWFGALVLLASFKL